MENDQFSLLVVDDNENNRDLLARRLKRLDYDVAVAVDGRDALEALRGRLFDLVLLDIMMPEMNGYEVLERMKGDETLRHIPVLMVSALDEMESVVRCIEAGAQDYLIKPFDPVLLQARVRACLRDKALRDQEELYLREIEAQRHRADELLQVILPKAVMEELKATNQVVPRRYEDVAVLFCDIVDFTTYCERHSPEEVLANLGECTEVFEEHSITHGLEKINSVGDEYVAAGGLNGRAENPVLDCVKCGLEMIRSAAELSAGWQVRIGIHIGPVVAGVVGKRKFLFGLWGDTMNTGARTQANGIPGEVCVTRDAWERIASLCRGESRGAIRVKGKGEMEMFRVEGLMLDEL